VNLILLVEEMQTTSKPLFFNTRYILESVKENFLKTDKIFFAIFYLRSIALDYFELFINKLDPLQDFNFLED